MSARLSRWQIGESGTAVTLDDRGRGEVTFTVTNVGEAQDRSMLAITPLDGALADWFVIEEPQRVVAPGASVVYPVDITVPPEVPAGTYGLQAVAYSADTDPQASSATSKRISLTLTRPAVPRKAPRWLWLVIAAVVVLLILLVVLVT
jgi:hypothetical protein